MVQALPNTRCWGRGSSVGGESLFLEVWIPYSWRFPASPRLCGVHSACEGEQLHLKSPDLHGCAHLCWGHGAASEWCLDFSKLSLDFTKVLGSITEGSQPSAPSPVSFLLIPSHWCRGNIFLLLPPLTKGVGVSSFFAAYNSTISYLLL